MRAAGAPTASRPRGIRLGGLSGLSAAPAWDGASNPIAEVRWPGERGRRSSASRSRPATISGDGIAGSLADFVKALRTGETPMTECHDNIKSFAMVMAALESSRSGRRVALTV